MKVPGLNRLLLIKSVLWIEAKGNYSLIHRTDERPYMTATTLKWFELTLPDFIRVHKAVLVNPAYVVDYNIGSRTQINWVRLENGEELPLSRRRKKFISTRLYEAVMKRLYPNQ